LQAVDFQLILALLALSFRTTTIHISGLYTDPPFLIHLASDLHHWFCPQASLLPCWLGFRQMGLAPYNGTHPLANINQFHVIINSQDSGFSSARATTC